ncbi:hypothetical protein SAMN05421819_4158 [Bryocella elongata]|uniref:DUF5343 domain-containing protein n=1 Tax=Bryocella elongata TaxID=863522 RepID=A0A1H6C1C5_9BACT|nr:DUF5343 domain-containing protein [Bryocella elongata]SEG66779.1 hypothetical protein SAMN05421819_4158 [Bryocella elongata]
MAEVSNPAVVAPTEAAGKASSKKLGTQLPYLASPGSIKTALDRIREAAAPERVHLDFVNTILKMKGGTGAAVIPFLKKIGFVASDGSPTELYKRFRNKTSGGAAMAAAIRYGYKPLGDSREYFYKLDDKDLLNLIVEVTGAELNSSAAKQILYTLNALREYADFAAAQPGDGEVQQTSIQEGSSGGSRPGGADRSKYEGVGLRLGYTINLNLPATTDQAVFNAIFRSLKEHLLSYGE